MILPILYCEFGATYLVLWVCVEAEFVNNGTKSHFSEGHVPTFTISLIWPTQQRPYRTRKQYRTQKRDGGPPYARTYTLPWYKTVHPPPPRATDISTNGRDEPKYGSNATFTLRH